MDGWMDVCCVCVRVVVCLLECVLRSAYVRMRECLFGEIFVCLYVCMHVCSWKYLCFCMYVQQDFLFVCLECLVCMYVYMYALCATFVCMNVCLFEILTHQHRNLTTHACCFSSHSLSLMWLHAPLHFSVSLCISVPPPLSLARARSDFLSLSYTHILFFLDRVIRLFLGQFMGAYFRRRGLWYLNRMNILQTTSEEYCGIYTCSNMIDRHVGGARGACKD